MDLAIIEYFFLSAFQGAMINPFAKRRITDTHGIPLGGIG